MSEPHHLQTPAKLADLILASAGDADDMALRPLMTGDVLKLDDGRLVALIQHPCAIRAGTELLERLLTCEVVALDGAQRSSWADEPFSRMLLPIGEHGPLQIDFRLPVVLSAQQAEAARRVAILERVGVNLLLQRWVHHTSRFVALTTSYDQMCAAEYIEVELLQDALDELVPNTLDKAAALKEIDRFLGQSLESKRDTWRTRLRDPQHHAAARRALNAHVNTLTSGGR